MRRYTTDFNNERKSSSCSKTFEFDIAIRRMRKLPQGIMKLKAKEKNNYSKYDLTKYLKGLRLDCRRAAFPRCKAMENLWKRCFISGEPKNMN